MGKKLHGAAAKAHAKAMKKGGKSRKALPAFLKRKMGRKR